MCSKNGDPDERQGSRRPGGRKIVVAGPIRGPPGEQKRLAPLKYISEWHGGGRVPVVWGTCSSGLTADLLGSCSARAGSPLPSPGSSISVGALAPAGAGGRVPLDQIIGDPLTEMERKRVTYLLTPDTRGAFRLIETSFTSTNNRKQQVDLKHIITTVIVDVLSQSPSTFTRLVPFPFFPLLLVVRPRAVFVSAARRLAKTSDLYVPIPFLRFSSLSTSIQIP